jgi:SAM-dependent methyltransferase
MSSESVTADPFLERLRTHSQALRNRPIATPPPPPPRAETGHLNHLAFWQSPVVRAAINRRVTGDATLAPQAYFAARYGSSLPAPDVLALRASDASLELALLQQGGCGQIVGLDPDAARAESANGNVPEELRERIRYQQGEPLAWKPQAPLGAVLARSVLHRQDDLEGMLDHVREILSPGGLLFVDEFIGPARFQWSDTQLEIINRLLTVLPDELVIDLGAEDGRRKRIVACPDPAVHAVSNPNDAVHSDRIVGCLDERFERVEVSFYGGAVYHQLFSRIMGNFASQPVLVRVLLEIDALLTDMDILASDYVWGVWRRA